MHLRYFTHTLHFLLSMVLSNTFSVFAPIINACPVEEPYLPPDDHTCHPISNDACTLWNGITCSHKLCQMVLVGLLNAAITSFSVVICFVLHFIASVAACVYFCNVENFLGYLYSSGKSTKCCHYSCMLTTYIHELQCLVVMYIEVILTQVSFVLFNRSTFYGLH